ncbi:hypothetical protein [Eisenibacter elegans]|jgi:hypothetical protein|uniref:hypothetical protein n=1 Tax=Eisenibacter elegans TaxID=997 RepID=UPI00041F69AF|nr:hypothetical protein [Eisenibacter elegans]
MGKLALGLTSVNIVLLVIFAWVAYRRNVKAIAKLWVLSKQNKKVANKASTKPVQGVSSKLHPKPQKRVVA